MLQPVFKRAIKSVQTLYYESTSKPGIGELYKCLVGELHDVDKDFEEFIVTEVPSLETLDTYFSITDKTHKVSDILKMCELLLKYRGKPAVTKTNSNIYESSWRDRDTLEMTLPVEIEDEDWPDFDTWCNSPEASEHPWSFTLEQINQMLEHQWARFFEPWELLELTSVINQAFNSERVLDSATIVSDTEEVNKQEVEMSYELETLAKEAGYKSASYVRKLCRQSLIEGLDFVTRKVGRKISTLLQQTESSMKWFSSLSKVQKKIKGNKNVSSQTSPSDRSTSIVPHVATVSRIPNETISDGFQSDDYRVVGGVFSVLNAVFEGFLSRLDAQAERIRDLQIETAKLQIETAEQLKRSAEQLERLEDLDTRTEDLQTRQRQQLAILAGC